MPFGSPRRGAQKASDTVIESPNRASVAGVPENLPRTSFIGSTQSGLSSARVEVAVISRPAPRTGHRSRFMMFLSIGNQPDAIVIVHAADYNDLTISRTACHDH